MNLDIPLQKYANILSIIFYYKLKLNINLSKLYIYKKLLIYLLFLIKSDLIEI